MIFICVHLSRLILHECHAMTFKTWQSIRALTDKTLSFPLIHLVLSSVFVLLCLIHHFVIFSLIMSYDRIGSLSFSPNIQRRKAYWYKKSEVDCYISKLIFLISKYAFPITVFIKGKRKRNTRSYGKSPQTNRKNQRDNIKTPPKTSITHRLRTALGRSAGVTIATQLVWLNQFNGIPSFPLTAKSCVVKCIWLKYR